MRGLGRPDGPVERWRILWGLVRGLGGLVWKDIWVGFEEGLGLRLEDREGRELSLVERKLFWRVF